MKILQINTVYPNGSTGKIVKGIYDTCKSNGIECKIASRFEDKKKKYLETLAVSSWLDCHIHNRLAKITMLQGCFSSIRTMFFLRKIKKESYNIIHLHNIHGSYINHSQLFKFIKRHRIKTVWTLHDCWSFTGGCPHYDMVKCEKWKTLCNNCPQKNGLFDATKIMHKKKKKWFLGIESMTIIANSNWTANQAKMSFLYNYPIKTIYNGIDLNVFHPTQSDIRRVLSCENKYIVLGVAFDWSARKGLDVFIELSRSLPEKYQIILVGTNEEIDKTLPDNIISIHKTQNQNKLAEIYTVADVFANPTREEAFGLVNIEALACGTPGVTFNTGGSPECYNEKCGTIVEKDDIEAFKREIIRICETKPYLKEDCISYAQAFDSNRKFQEYINLYKDLIDE